MKNLFLVIGVMFYFSSCDPFDVSKSDKLHLEKREYTENQLRIDGYYYQLYNNQYFDFMIFYKDGTILTPGGLESKIESVDNYIINSFIKKGGYEKVLYWWGAFNIEEDNIAFEKWYPSEAPYKAHMSEGKIINDTTFLITKRYRLVNGIQTKIRDIDDEYHFRPFSPKPDSTNNFMDNFWK